MMRNQCIQDFGQGVTREILFNEQLVIYTIDNLQDEVMDAWYSACMDTIAWYPRERTMRTIHHLQNHETIFSPHIRQKIYAVVKAANNWDGYAAIIIQPSQTLNIVELLMRQLSKIFWRWNVRFFQNRRDAIEWLMAQSD